MWSNSPSWFCVFCALLFLSIWVKHLSFHSQVYITQDTWETSFKQTILGGWCSLFISLPTWSPFPVNKTLLATVLHRLFLHRSHLEIWCKVLRNSTLRILLIWLGSSRLGEVSRLLMTLSWESSMSRNLTEPQRSDLEAQYVTDLNKKIFWVFYIHIVLLNPLFILHFLML